MMKLLISISNRYSRIDCRKSNIPKSSHPGNLVYNLGMMNETTHNFVTGIQNGYELSEADKAYLDRLFYEGFKIHRSNDRIILGEKACTELRESLLAKLAGG